VINLSVNTDLEDYSELKEIRVHFERMTVVSGLAVNLMVKIIRIKMEEKQN